MADTNNERVGKALALLTQGLAPFVDRECALHHRSRVVPAREVPVRFAELHQRHGIPRRQRHERFEGLNGASWIA